MISVQARVRTNKNAAAAVSAGTRDGLLDAAGHGFRVSQERVAAQSTDTGQLLRSGFPPEVLGDGSILWGYSASYARYVEEGTRPHFPPVDALRGWARRVLGSAAAAWGVARKIAREGTDPKPFVEPGIVAMKARLQTRGISAFIEERL